MLIFDYCISMNTNFSLSIRFFSQNDGKIYFRDAKGKYIGQIAHCALYRLQKLSDLALATLPVRGLRPIYLSLAHAAYCPDKLTSVSSSVHV